MARPGFNIIIGPNGSGKSAIVSAVALGLGASVHALKRQTNLADFVHTNTPEGENARVIIRLHTNDPDVLHTVQLDIFKDGQATYDIDGKDATREEVESFAQGQQIQTGNLCQFLPQDVVREFPEMTGGQVFENTVRAVGDGDLIQLHKRIRHLQREQSKTLAALQQKADTRRDLENKYASNQGLLDNWKIIEQLKERIKLFQTRLEYDQAIRLRKELRGMTQKQKVLEKNWQEAVRKSEDAQEKLAAQNTEMKRIDNEKSSKLYILRSCEKKMNSKDFGPGMSVARLQKEITDANESLSHIEQNKTKKERHLREEEARMKTLREKLVNFDEKKLELRLKAARQNCERARIKVDNVKTAIDEVNASISEKQRAKIPYLAKLRECRSKPNRKLELLKKSSEDAYKGAIWLEKNKSQFSKQVFSPIMTTIDLLDDSYGVYVERLVNARDLLAFVCEDAQEMTRLTNELRERQRLKVNIIHWGRTSVNKSMPMSKAVKDNLLDFVSDMFVSPPLVKSYLCHQYNLHNVPVFSDDADVNDIPSNIRSFFIDKDYHRVMKNRYSSGFRREQENLRRFVVRKLVTEENRARGEISGLEQHLEIIDVDLEQLHVRLISKKDELKTNEIQLKKTNEVVDEAQQEIKNVLKLNEDIQASQGKLQMWRNLSNPELSREQLLRQKRSAMANLKKCISLLAIEEKKCHSLLIDLAKMETLANQSRVSVLNLPYH